MLQQTDVLAEAFRMRRVGPYMAINGLRLGMPSSGDISFIEVNAALGRLATMVAEVTKRIGHTFQVYQVVPMGSTSFLSDV